MPRTKKPAGTAVDRRNGRRADLTVVAGQRFDPPAGLTEPAVAAWDAYWDDRVASVHTAADKVVLVRWITELDRYLRLSAEADKMPLVTGSTGQLVKNPAYAIAYEALSVVQACEKQLGVGALNRSALGIAVIAETKSLAEMNARYGGVPVAGDNASPVLQPAQDPRVIDA